MSQQEVLEETATAESVQIPGRPDHVMCETTWRTDLYEKNLIIVVGFYM